MLACFPERHHSYFTEAESFAERRRKKRMRMVHEIETYDAAHFWASMVVLFSGPQFSFGKHSQTEIYILETVC